MGDDKKFVGVDLETMNLDYGYWYQYRKDFYNNHFKYRYDAFGRLRVGNGLLDQMHEEKPILKTY